MFNSINKNFWIEGLHPTHPTARTWSETIVLTRVVFDVSSLTSLPRYSNFLTLTLKQESNVDENGC